MLALCFLCQEGLFVWELSKHIKVSPWIGGMNPLNEEEEAGRFSTKLGLKAAHEQFLVSYRKQWREVCDIV